ncbi:MAG TPA: VanZ family protein [Bacteroidales bacterium]|nr:VanZ family protein [Bacteroidales bacterium]
MVYLFLKQYYKSIIIGLLILWLSLTGSNIPVPGRMLDIPYLDKIGHFGMYAFFSAILLLDSCRWEIKGKFHYLILFIPLFFGALMEILQMTLTATRKAEELDLLANMGGIAAGVLLAYIAKKLIAKIR